jgi:hypothetical protein
MRVGWSGLVSDGQCWSVLLAFFVLWRAVRGVRGVRLAIITLLRFCPDQHR